MATKRLLIGLVVLAMLSWLLPGIAVEAADGSYTCTGGTIPAGTYQSLVIEGKCSIPTGTVVVRGGVTILPGASLDAGSPKATVDITGGVLVEKGGTFILGCSPSVPACSNPNITTNDRVDGGITADQAAALILHGNSINGHVSMQGGSGFYSAFENNKVNGGVLVSGYKSFWLGFIRNQVNGTVTFENNSVTDPDAIELGNNTIHGDLNCSGNSKVDIGDEPGAMQNTVSGNKTGQCASL